MLKQVSQSITGRGIPPVLVRVVEEHGYTLNQLIRRWTPTTPAQLTGSTNDYDIGDANVVRLDASTPIDITGLARGEEGRFLTLINVSANTITLKHQDAGSTAQNRIIGLGGVDFSLAADVSALLWYDDVSQRWRQLK